MINYIVRRIWAAIPVLVGISIISFVVIQLPPGDYMSAIKSQMQSLGGLTEDEAEKIAQQLRKVYGLDKPLVVQYLLWIKNMITKGSLGFSFQYRKDVGGVIWSRLGWTMLVALSCHAVSTIVGLLIGIYSARHQYRLGDNLATIFAFAGLSIPSFFFALVIMFITSVWFGLEAGGLFSQYYVVAPWSWAKFVDFLKHFWVPVVIVGFAGTARNMRVMRGNLLDVLNSQYVLTARSKGLRETVVIYKHAVVNALHPIIMYQGIVLPFMIQGETAASIVLNLPTTGPMFYDALVAQDMYLAGAFLMMLALVLVIGNLLADVLLAWVDPRIKYD
jgi:peptide/nickel transport system permease protein